MKRFISAFLATLMALALALSGIGALAEEEMFYLPGMTKVIGEQAFYGDTSVKKVVVPEGTQRIEAKAFAKGGVELAVLPDSLEYIAPDAFDDCPLELLGVNENSYAHRWAEQNGFGGLLCIVGEVDDDGIMFVQDFQYGEPVQLDEGASGIRVTAPDYGSFSIIVEGADIGPGDIIIDDEDSPDSDGIIFEDGDSVDVSTGNSLVIRFAEWLYEGIVNGTIRLIVEFEEEVAAMPASLEIDEESVKMAQGDILRLWAWVEPEDADQAVTWSSSNTRVATVDDKGNVTAVGKGSARITATCKADTSLKATCAVQVKAPRVEIMGYLGKDHVQLATGLGMQRVSGADIHYAYDDGVLMMNGGVDSESDLDGVDYLEIEQDNDDQYMLAGIYVGMNRRQALAVLKRDGWTEQEDAELVAPTLWYGKPSSVKGVDLELQVFMDSDAITAGVMLTQVLSDTVPRERTELMGYIGWSKQDILNELNMLERYNDNGRGSFLYHSEDGLYLSAGFETSVPGVDYINISTDDKGKYQLAGFWLGMTKADSQRKLSIDRWKTIVAPTSYSNSGVYEKSFSDQPVPLRLSIDWNGTDNNVSGLSLSCHVSNDLADYLGKGPDELRYLLPSLSYDSTNNVYESTDVRAGYYDDELGFGDGGFDWLEITGKTVAEDYYICDVGVEDGKEWAKSVLQKAGWVERTVLSDDNVGLYIKTFGNDNDEMGVEINYYGYSSIDSIRIYRKKVVTYRALLIAENDHAMDGAGVDGKGYVHQDISSANIATALNARHGAHGEHWMITDILDYNKPDILTSIQDTFAAVDDNDVSLIYVCSHGKNDYGDARRGFYTPDGDISYNELAAAVSAIPGTKIVLVDTCHSGMATDSKYSPFVGMDRTYVIAAVRNNSSITDPKDPDYTFVSHSNNYGTFFSQRLLSGLVDDLQADGKGSTGIIDGKITVAELFDYIDELGNQPLTKPDSNGNEWYDRPSILLGSNTSKDYVIFTE